VTLDPIQVPEQEGLAPLKDLVKQALDERPDLEQNASTSKASSWC